MESARVVEFAVCDGVSVAYSTDAIPEPVSEDVASVTLTVRGMVFELYHTAELSESAATAVSFKLTEDIVGGVVSTVNRLDSVAAVLPELSVTVAEKVYVPSARCVPVLFVPMLKAFS